MLVKTAGVKHMVSLNCQIFKKNIQNFPSSTGFDIIWRPQGPLLKSRTWMTLQFLKVIYQALETYAASLTSVSSAALLVSTAFFLKKLPDPDCLTILATIMTNIGPLWIGYSKIQFFTDIWHPFCRRLLRPAFVIFLKIGWWNSNAQTSETHWCLHYNLKVIFRWSPRPLKYIKTGRKTLYSDLNVYFIFLIFPS